MSLGEIVEEDAILVDSKRATDDGVHALVQVTLLKDTIALLQFDPDLGASEVLLSLGYLRIIYNERRKRGENRKKLINEQRHNKDNNEDDGQCEQLPSSGSSSGEGGVEIGWLVRRGAAGLAGVVREETRYMNSSRSCKFLKNIVCL